MLRFGRLSPWQPSALRCSAQRVSRRRRSGPARARSHRHHRARHEAGGRLLRQRARLQGSHVVRAVRRRQGHVHEGRCSTSIRTLSSHRSRMIRCGYGSNIELFQLYLARSAGHAAQEQRHRRLSHRLLCRRHQGSEKLSRQQGRVDVLRTVPGERRPGRRPGHHLLHGALGAADGIDHLSERNGLREDLADQAVVADRPGEVSTFLMPRWPGLSWPSIYFYRQVVKMPGTWPGIFLVGRQ